MNTSLYIIPGYKETCRRKPYQSLATLARSMGYNVVFKNINWNKDLSSQVFSVSEDSVLFGFSLGAVVAWLVAQDNPCKQLILASMTPLHCFKQGDVTREALVELLGASNVDNLEKNLQSSHKAHKQTILYGDKEEERGDVLVPNTEHEINKNYLKEVGKIL
jgi:esterase/lipase